MTSKYFWRGVLIVVLSMIVAKPAEAKGYPSGGAIVAAIVGVASVIVIVAVVVIHQSTQKRTITGCVKSQANGMSVIDDKDHRLYALSGNTTDVKPGDRMVLQGKKGKPADSGRTLVWETKQATRDLGVCQL